MTVETLARAKTIERDIKDTEEKMNTLQKQIPKIDAASSGEFIKMSFRGSDTMEVNARRLNNFLMSECEEYEEVRKELQKELEEL